jgi:hypothetical protein
MASGGRNHALPCLYLWNTLELRSRWHCCSDLCHYPRHAAQSAARWIVGPGASKGRNSPVTSTPPLARLEGGRCAHVDGLRGIIFGPPPVRDGGGEVEGVAGVELEVSSPL